MNLLLVVWDALRADRVGIYGAPRDTTPFLDQLASDGRWYPRFFSSANSTLPALASLFSGADPFAHGVFSRRGEMIRAGMFDLSGKLAAEGFRAGALDNLVRENSWLGRGFVDRMDLRRAGAIYNPTTEFVETTRAWLRENAGNDFFFYLRLCSTHTPYTAPRALQHRYYRGDPTTTNLGSLDGLRSDPVRKEQVLAWLEESGRTWPGASGDRVEDIEWVRAQYDACVRDGDDGLRAIYEELCQLGVAENTLIVVLGDHGESLGEHGITCDHHGLYDVTLRTPLVLHGPGVDIGRDNSITRTSEVAGLILESLGMAPPRSIARPGADETLRASESSWMFKHALRSPHWKYILSLAEDAWDGPGEELYDLVADPAEEYNLATALPLQARKMRRELEASVRREFEDAGLDEDPIAVLAREHNGRLFAPVAPRAGPGRVRQALRRLRSGRLLSGGA